MLSLLSPPLPAAQPAVGSGEVAQLAEGDAAVGGAERLPHPAGQGVLRGARLQHPLQETRHRGGGRRECSGKRAAGRGRGADRRQAAIRYDGARLGEGGGEGRGCARPCLGTMEFDWEGERGGKGSCQAAN